MDQQILFVLGSRTCVPEDPLVAARQLGLRSIVFTPRPPGCGTATDLMDRIDFVDVRYPEQAVRLAREVHERTPVLGVLGYEEDATLMAAHIAAGLGLPAHPVDAALAAMDKPTMKERFVAAGVPCADFIVAADEDDAVTWANGNGYPVVVKPCRGGASQGVIRADDEPALRQAYRRLRRIIRDHELDNGDRPRSAQLVERYLPGNEVSVELLLQHGDPEIITEFGKPLPLTGPFFEETIYITPPTLDSLLRKEVHELAVNAAHALGFHHGPAHCEIRLTPDGPRVLEIAGRLLGGACARSFRDRLGGDVHSYMLRAAMGERVTIPPPPEEAPVVGALMMPVPGEGRVVAVGGVERARRVPGVWDVTMMATPGDVMVPFPEQSCYAVGFVSASGRDEAEVVDSLSWAGSSITVELETLDRDRWTRAVNAEDANYQTDALLAAADTDQDVTGELAEILFDELPRADAVAAAADVVKRERDTERERCWIRVAGVGFLLGGIAGPTGHIGPGGPFPDSRGSQSQRHLIQAIIAEFARRGATECEIETDPRRPALAATLSALGFTRQPSTVPVTTRTLTCALTPSTVATGTTTGTTTGTSTGTVACAGEGDAGDAQRCCC